ncbi:MAG: FAD-dependent oxidoreductase [bacterium]
MTAKRRLEEASPVRSLTWRDMPPMNVSLGSMLHNRTGGWRYVRPLMQAKVSACQNACPAGNDVPGWIRLLHEGAVQEACRHLKLEQPFPAILGRVCFSFCQGACNRSGLDQSVEVRELERFLGDRAQARAEPPDLPPCHGSSVAVVGSGPAGLSAAYFARRLGFRVTLFEKLGVLGGILRIGIPAYRLPRRIVEAEIDALSGMGIELRSGTEIGRQVSLKELRTDFDYVFLGTGAHASRRLGIPGEQDSGRVTSGLEALRRVALGEPFDPGRSVIVVGGGNTAIDAARTALRRGCEVTVLYRRSEAEMPAHPEEIRQAREEGVRFRFLAAPEEVRTSSDGSLRQLVCCETELGEEDGTGRRRSVRKEGSLFRLEAETVLCAIGEEPDLRYIGHRFDADGLTLRARTELTGDDGRGKVLAGGDILHGPRSVAHAVAAGKRAAVSMDCDRRGLEAAAVMEAITAGQGPAVSFAAYLEREWERAPQARRDLREVVDASKMRLDRFHRASPVARRLEAADTRKTSFDEYAPGYEQHEALREADRCMQCGRCTACSDCLIFCPDMSVVCRECPSDGFQVDLDYCKGCGICANECPRHFITMVEEDSCAATEA